MNRRIVPADRLEVKEHFMNSKSSQRTDRLKAALCKVHLDMHCPDWHDSIFENFDAGDIIRHAADAGAEALYFFTKDCYGNAYYATEIGHRHRCMGDRDFLAEILAEAGKVDLPIMAYSTIIWDNVAAEANPEWRMRDPHGKELSDTVTMELAKWRYLCHNSGYVDYMRQMIEEISANYPIDGYHLDMFNYDFGGLSCYCANCRKAFRDRTGQELPESPSSNAVWREFLEFRYDSVERFFNVLKETALRQNPDLCMVANYHGSPNFDWRVGQQPVRHSAMSDLGTGETYTPMLGDMYPGMEARFIRNLVPGKPFELVAWRMNRITDFTVKPLHQFRWEVLTCVLNGGSAMFIDQPFHDGQVDPVAYDRMAEVFTEVQTIKPHLGGDFVRHVGLYYSCRTRDLYGRDDQARFILPVMGAYKALIENHFQVDFIFDETVSLEALRTYALVFLPDVAVLGDDEVEQLKAYVAEGGRVIATNNTSRYSPEGDPLDHFRLGEVFGVDFQKTLDCDNNYFRNLPDALSHAIDPRYHVLNQGPVQIVEPISAVGQGDLHDAFFKRSIPDRFFSHNIHPPYHRLSDAFYLNDFGGGHCIYIPFGLDRSYADIYELPEHRHLVGNLVRHLSETPCLEVEGPLNMEAVLTRKDNQLRVHLTMFAPIRQATSLPSLNEPVRPSLRMEEKPLYRATLRSRKPFKRVTAFRDNTVVQVNGNEIRLLCEDVHECICITD